MSLSPFHIAFPVNDLATTRQFWGGVLGCPEGRSAEHWVDFDLFGHQITAHVAPSGGDRAASPVDGKSVPIPHFGVILGMEEWQALADRLTAAGTVFLIEPYIRFKGQPGEQATMFFRDPSGNAVEMKGFADRSQMFATG